LVSVFIKGINLSQGKRKILFRFFEIKKVLGESFAEARERCFFLTLKADSTFGQVLGTCSEQSRESGEHFSEKRRRR